MKVKVEFTVDVPDFIRREINVYHAQEGLADREAIKAWYEQFGRSMDDDLALWADEREEAEDREREAARDAGA